MERTIIHSDLKKKRNPATGIAGTIPGSFKQ